jgi:ATP-binding cassette subfamily G (WHITE) protein 2 (SNQ2)
MLEVIGAGATATSTIDWYDVWKKSPEATAAALEIQRIHEEGRSQPAVETKQHTEYSTSWIHQTSVVVRRGAAAIWRNPGYVIAKSISNVAGSLFVGFTFWKSPSTEQGIQNKLFSVFTVVILTVPSAQQLQISFLVNRAIYEIRERPSKMYSWSAWVTAQILVELPWNMGTGIPFFLGWYWTVGYPADRAGFTFLIFTVILPLYYTTFGQAISAMSPTAEIAALAFITAFSLSLML